VPKNRSRANHEINWGKYPVRVCHSLHECRVCGGDITLKQLYFDGYYEGGYGTRAHTTCVLGKPDDEWLECDTWDWSGPVYVRGTEEERYWLCPHCAADYDFNRGPKHDSARAVS